MSKITQNIQGTFSTAQKTVGAFTEDVKQYTRGYVTLAIVIALVIFGSVYNPKPKTALATEPQISAVQEPAKEPTPQEEIASGSVTGNDVVEVPKTQELTIEQAQKEITKRNPNSPLTAQQIYDSAKKYNASFTIAVLQGIQEGNFGKDKNSKPYKTKNLWNWDNTDNGNIRTFATFEDGLDWYMSRVVVGYGNDTKNLLENFVTKTSKKRYASDPSYEKSLRQILAKIK